MDSKVIAQGAEAVITLDDNEINKSRIEKSYRHHFLDEKIRRTRTKTEAKILQKAHEFGVNVPKIIFIEKFKLKIEFIDGDKLSERLNFYEKEKQLKVMEKVGKETAKLHKNDLIHGDLTTSNIILKRKEVFTIDFGLGFFSSKIEDKAVDLHLIKQALEAKHYQNYEKLFESFLKGYKWKDFKKVIERLKVVEKRGRYKC